MRHRIKSGAARSGSPQTISLPLVGESRSPAPSGTPDHPGRDLLVRGNGKLGDDIVHWDLPAIKTCPGRSRCCSGVIRTGPQSKGSRRCYMLRFYGFRPSVRTAHERNLAALTDLKGWSRRILSEIRRRHVRSIRWHTSGDVFSVAYAKALLFIMAASPNVEHFLYSRSWRVPRLRLWLEKMAALKNVAVWFSVDASTGLPDRVPPHVHLAWMALHAAEGEPWACGDDIRRCDLVFLDTPLRQLGLSTFGGTRVCPQESNPNVTCSSCRHCLPGTRS